MTEAPKVTQMSEAKLLEYAGDTIKAFDRLEANLEDDCKHKDASRVEKAQAGLRQLAEAKDLYAAVNSLLKFLSPEGYVCPQSRRTISLTLQEDTKKLRRLMEPIIFSRYEAKQLLQLKKRGVYWAV